MTNSEILFWGRRGFGGDENVPGYIEIMIKGRNEIPHVPGGRGPFPCAVVPMQHVMLKRNIL